MAKSKCFKCGAPATFKMTYKHTSLKGCPVSYSTETKGSMCNEHAVDALRAQADELVYYAKWIENGAVPVKTEPGSLPGTYEVKT